MANAIDIAKRANNAYGPSLAGLCQKFIGLCISAYLGREAPGGYLSARDAYEHSAIVSWDPNDAQVGDIVYFEYGGPTGPWHVGFVVGRSGGRAIMASGTGNTRGMIQDLGGGVLISWVDEYASSRPFKGVSRANGTRPAMTGLTGWDPFPKPAPAPSGYTFKMVVGDGLTYQEPTGDWANRILRGVVQFGLDPKTNSLSDGVIGTNTRKAIQRSVRAYGYTGPIDGRIGRNTIKGVQRRAKALGGYTGPIDGIPGINTWNGYAKSLGQ